MREIKFRLWNNAAKEMLPVVGTFGFLKGDVCRISAGKTNNRLKDGWVNVEPEDMDKVVLMQYIGLKDANGVEIYEGDFLVNSCGNYVICRFSYFEFWPSGDIDETFNPELSHVIGNIYENPELPEAK